MEFKQQGMNKIRELLLKAIKTSNDAIRPSLNKCLDLLPLFLDSEFSEDKPVDHHGLKAIDKKSHLEFAVNLRFWKDVNIVAGLGVSDILLPEPDLFV